MTFKNCRHVHIFWTHLFNAVNFAKVNVIWYPYIWCHKIGILRAVKKFSYESQVLIKVVSGVPEVWLNFWHTSEVCLYNRHLRYKNHKVLCTSYRDSGEKYSCVTITTVTILLYMYITITALNNYIFQFASVLLILKNMSTYLISLLIQQMTSWYLKPPVWQITVNIPSMCLYSLSMHKSTTLYQYMWPTNLVWNVLINILRQLMHSWQATVKVSAWRCHRCTKLVLPFLFFCDTINDFFTRVTVCIRPWYCTVTTSDTKLWSKAMWKINIPVLLCKPLPSFD